MTVKLVFGMVQALLACATIVLAMLIKFNVFTVQSSMIIPKDALNFYFVILLGIGSISVTSGLFLIHDWLESE